MILCVLILFNSVFQIVSSIPLGTINRVFESEGDLSAGAIIDIFRQKAVWMKSEIIGPAGIIMGADQFGVRDFLFGVLGLVIISGLIKLKRWAIYAFIAFSLLDFILSVFYLKKPVSDSVVKSLVFQYGLSLLLSLYVTFQRKVFR